MGWFTGTGATVGGGAVPGNYEAVSVSTAAVGLTVAAYRPESGRYAGREARGAQISIEGGDIRFRVDGGDPTASEGHPALEDTELVLADTQTIRQFRAIRSGSADATLRVTYFF